VKKILAKFMADESVVARQLWLEMTSRHLAV
jgi:hypothetical protein